MSNSNDNQPGGLKLTASLHRLAYQAMPSPQQAYVLLEALPVENASQSINPPVNFSMVLDRSGSMAGEKLRYLKEAAKLIVDRLRSEDWLSVIIFDDTADIIIPSGVVIDRELIQRKIDAIEERGGTHMSAGMTLGLQELQRGQNPERVSSMLLLTDGQTWEDADQCNQVADRCQAAGIPIKALGLGVGERSNWDPRLLEELARRSGGEWIAIDSPENVMAVFDETLTALQAVSATNAHLTMRMVEGLSPRAVWRVKPSISRLDHQVIGEHDVQVFLGEIQSGAGQSILADLLLPPRKPGAYRLIQADITYDVPGSGVTSQRAAIDVVVTYTEDILQSNQTDQRLMNIIERVVAHKLQTQALDEAARGESERATQRLRAAATRLLELGEVDLAEQASQQAQNLEQSGQVDIAAAQRMRYATKKLTEADREG